jgi:hypothetical protein
MRSTGESGPDSHGRGGLSTTWTGFHFGIWWIIMDGSSSWRIADACDRGERYRRKDRRKHSLFSDMNLFKKDGILIYEAGRVSRPPNLASLLGWVAPPSDGTRTGVPERDQRLDGPEKPVGPARQWIGKVRNTQSRPGQRVGPAETGN